MIHRGPDGRGFWRKGEEGERGVMFCHRRLAILDVREIAGQPMVDANTGTVVTYNGEIYNYQELRRELNGLGHGFLTDSDTEVLLKAYVQWGEACFQRLRGMFAFALWDPRTNEVVLVRDRLGIKPLYYAQVKFSENGAALLFASEVRALLASGLVSRRLSPLGVSTYFWNGFVAGPDTIIQDVRSIRPGTIVKVDLSGTRFRSKKFWSLPFRRGVSSDIGALREELDHAAKIHLHSDVPLGVFLSGGIDSSAVAALCARHSDTTLNTFTISFDEVDFDESQYARAVSRELGAHHTELSLTHGIFSNQLEDALGSIDQPTFDAINTYFVSRAVREAGITVAVAGTGGDELFGGYSSFVDIPRAAKLARLGASFPQWMLGLILSRIARRNPGTGAVPPQTRWGKLEDVLATRGGLVELYQVFYGLFTQDFLRELTRDGMGPQINWGLSAEFFGELGSRVKSSDILQAVSVLELSCFLGERLLRDTDAASMGVSLEVRVPLVDHRVLEEAAKIRSRIRFEPVGKKRLLRDLTLGGVNPKMFDRPKSGFVLPIAAWCREKLRDQVEDVLADKNLCNAVGLRQEAVARLWGAFQAGAPGIYWSRVWSLYVLLVWCKAHKVAL